MKTILLPTDFSNNSRYAINYAIRLFGPGCEYILMHSFQTPQAGATMLYSINDLLEKEAIEGLERLASEITSHHEATLTLSIEAIWGDVFGACKQVVRKRGVDLIVMGTKGATGLKETFIGSNTASVIQGVNCPVLAIPENTFQALPRQIALATDYRDIAGDGVFAPLKFIMERSNAELTVVHVEMEGVPAGGTRETVSKDAWLKHLGNIPYQFQRIEEEDVAEGLEEFMEEAHPDMLVVIEHHYPFFERLFHRSVTKLMAMHTHIPLLALSDAKHDITR